MPKVIYPLHFASSIAFAEAEPTPEGIQFFGEKVRPILIDSCFEDHSRQAYQRRVNRDVVKPVDFESYAELVEEI